MGWPRVAARARRAAETQDKDFQMSVFQKTIWTDFWLPLAAYAETGRPVGPKALRTAYPISF